HRGSPVQSGLARKLGAPPPRSPGPPAAHTLEGRVYPRPDREASKNPVVGPVSGGTGGRDGGKSGSGLGVAEPASEPLAATGACRLSRRDKFTRLLPQPFLQLREQLQGVVAEDLAPDPQSVFL